MTDIALLPCPHCGGKEHEIGVGDEGHSVTCHSFSCRSSTGAWHTREQAIAAWNRRASPSQVAPANPAPRKEQTWQKPGERAAQGAPADEQSGETSHDANPAQGVTGEQIDLAHEIARRIATSGKTGRVHEIVYDAATEGALEAIRSLTAAIGAGAQAVAELHGPFGWLNGHRALAEDSWTLESDPLENSEEYFAIPLYALVDPFKEIGKDFDGKPALTHTQPLPLKEEVERVLEPFAEEAKEWADDVPDGYHPGVTEPGHGQAHASAKFSLGHLRSANALLSRLRAGEQEGWRSMDSAPKDKTPVIIAVPNKDKNDYTIGEAYFDPDNYDGGDWWWAGTDYGDYHAGPISDINHNPPEYWQPLPASPSVSEGGSR